MHPYVYILLPLCSSVFVLAGTGLPRTAPPRDRRAEDLEEHFNGEVDLDFVFIEMFFDGLCEVRIVLSIIRFRP